MEKNYNKITVDCFDEKINEDIEEFKIYLETAYRFKYSRNRTLNFICDYISFLLETEIDYKNIKLKDLNNYMHTVRTKGLCNGSLNGYVKSIKCFYKFLHEYGKISDSCFLQVQKLKFYKEPKFGKREIFTEKEINRILNRVANSGEFYIPIIKLKAYIWLYFFTGLRRSEMFRLKRKNFFTSECRLIVEKCSKNDITKFSIYPKFVAELIEEYFKSEEEVINAFNITNRIDQKIFKALKEFSPEKNINSRNMRHSFATDLCNLGLNLQEVQLLMGHQSPVSTMKYVDLNFEKIQKKINKLRGEDNE